MAAHQPTGEKPKSQEQPTGEKSKPQEARGGSSAPARAVPSAPAHYRPGSPFPAAGWEPVRRLREEFERMFEAFGGWPAPWEGGGQGRHWGLDVQESGDNVIVRAEAPGFEPNDFDLQVRGDQLVLRATHKAESEEPERGFREWHRQELYRAVPLPPGIDADHVQATYRNGVLTVTLPKTEESKGRRINVQG